MIIIKRQLFTYLVLQVYCSNSQLDQHLAVESQQLNWIEPEVNLVQSILYLPFLCLVDLPFQWNLGLLALCIVTKAYWCRSCLCHSYLLWKACELGYLLLNLQYSDLRFSGKRGRYWESSLWCSCWCLYLIACWLELILRFMIASQMLSSNF